jgi:serine protease Do
VYAAESARAEAAREQLARATDLSEAFKYVAKALRPSVVSIKSVQRARVNTRQFNDRRRQLPPELEEFFGEQFGGRSFQFPMPDRMPERRGQGTGVITSSDGYIVTNNHVVDGADEVTVTLSDGRDFDGQVVGTDEQTDLALLRINASNLVPAQLGNSDALEVGQWVVAVGSPFGLDQTVTAGIISATGRADVGLAAYEDFIQTDAAINPGNSGGPLVNLQGEVVGINTAIASRTGGYMGIGFAIPSNMVRSITGSILQHGRVDRGWLGAGIQDLTEELAESFGYRGTDGVLVSQVYPDSPAAEAGFQAGDIIVKFGGKPTRDRNQLRYMVASTPPGTKTTVTVFRQGQQQELSVTTALLDVERLTQTSPPRGSISGLGMTSQTLTPELAEQLGYDQDVTGVVVTEVESGSPADRAGMQVRDVIVSVDGKPVRGARDFRAATENADLDRGMRLLILRNNVRQFVVIKRPS